MKLMTNCDFSCRRPKNNSAILDKDALQRAETHYGGALSRWLKHHARYLSAEHKDKAFFEIAVSQIFKSYENGHADALHHLDRIVNCTQSSRCFQVCCPACRRMRQDKASSELIDEFKSVDQTQIKFMTLLICVEKDPDLLPERMANARKLLRNALSNNRVALGTNAEPLSIVGAFEIDMKNLSTQSDASKRSQELIKALGYDPRHKPSQYLLHLHAVVGALDDNRRTALKSVIAKAFGGLLPYQLDIRSLYKTDTKDENLDALGRYMYKARLQFSDNIFDDNWMQKKSKYHTPYGGKELVNYLNMIDAMHSFKGLKFECRL